MYNNINKVIGFGLCGAPQNVDLGLLGARSYGRHECIYKYTVGNLLDMCACLVCFTAESEPPPRQLFMQ